MSLFGFRLEEILAFFAVLIRYSVMLAVCPFFGDKVIPGPVKILLPFAISICAFPVLKANGTIQLADVAHWASSTTQLVWVVVAEVLTALTLGFVSRMLFEAIHMGSGLIGNFMGFAMASTFDPHQETQTEILAQLQTTLVMLIFLAMNGHYYLLGGLLRSYSLVGIGGFDISPTFGQFLSHTLSEMFLFGLEIAAPIGLSIFAVNLVFGLMARALPQLNIFALSSTVTALIGFFVLFLDLPEFSASSWDILSRIGDQMHGVLTHIGGKG